MELALRRFEPRGGSHTDGNGRDLRVCDGQLVIDGRFTVGE
jgi:hypothetical protein